MNIVLLDNLSLGADVDYSIFDSLGSVTAASPGTKEEAGPMIADADIVIVNKTRLEECNLSFASHLSLICVTATGYDNVDVGYCRSRNIGVANVAGYSTDSVCQVTVSLALALWNHLPEYERYVSDGTYSSLPCQNCLEPAFREIAGKTWGILGYGNIGRAVGKAAKALGCRVMAYDMDKSSEDCADFEDVIKSSDIISLHLPCSDGTRGIISKEVIDSMKTGVVLINSARGALTDEAAVAEAVKSGKIGAFGCDVYSAEPFPADHPFSEIMGLPNVILTPHMAWGAVEARNRLITEVYENVVAFQKGERRSRVD